ncbi:hypothetical protein TNCV_499191 [Trichonephila clavipes]|nr:hypothetical protein TNCV_499081 [Trichonephila clavipes]GFX80652.1 hypothetical protein TNCV_499191 [Trichonephila clavipes]
MPDSPPRIAIQQPRTSSSGTPPFTQECTRGIPILLREGQVEPDGPRRPHGGQNNKIFPRVGSVCHVPGDAARI